MYNKIILVASYSWMPELMSRSSRVKAKVDRVDRVYSINLGQPSVDLTKLYKINSADGQ